MFTILLVLAIYLIVRCVIDTEPPILEMTFIVTTLTSN